VHLQKLKTAALLGGALFAGTTAFAQDSGALIDALIRKGILTNQEAEQIRADLVRDSNTVPAHAMAGGKSTDRLSIGMRMQVQYANLDTDVNGAAFGPVATDHFFLRRMYLTLKAGLGADWGAQFTYDFAGGSYDDAIIIYEPSKELKFDFGLRKVNSAYEERRTSGDLRAIERSGVTRYFVESNNGRRLGAASYRIGAFMEGNHPISDTLGLVYGAAVTTPERNETFSLASSSGDNTNNHVALWANVGLTGKLGQNAGTWAAGVGYGWEPDQGGFGTTNLGRGYDLNLYSVYFDGTFGRFSLLGEYLTADVERGRANSSNAWPRGFFVQPSLLLTDTVEAVVRYSWLDTDGRGVTLADVVRSAPSGGTMNKFTEWFGGVNWYLRGNDLKLQLGGIYGETKDTVAGAPAKAKTVGARSQVQLQF
jgi:polyhydroxyalkanoate synthesis regulator phasin